LKDEGVFEVDGDLEKGLGNIEKVKLVKEKLVVGDVDDGTDF
jgi:hypothetical protein